MLTPEELKQYRGEKPPVVPSADRERPSQDDGKSSDNAVIVSGVGDMLVRFAHCCNPLPGEVITGFITRGRGVTVHLAGCPHALATDPQRRVPVVWKVGEESLRPIRLEVLCVDQPGLLAAMSKAIAAAGVNISTAEVKTTGQDGRALVAVRVEGHQRRAADQPDAFDCGDRRGNAGVAARPAREQQPLPGLTIGSPRSSAKIDWPRTPAV